MLTRIAAPGRRTQAGIVALVLILFAGDFAIVSWPSVAQAQERDGQRPRSLLDILLFRRRVYEQTAGREEAPAGQGQGQAALEIAQRQPDQLEPPVVAKLDTARTIIVIGDFMASGLADGLNAAYAQNPGIKIIDRSNGSSGFVRTDFHDWPAEIKTLIEAEKPAAVVIMIGANDRQQMKLGDAKEQPLSDAWTKEYQVARRRAGCGDQAAQPALHLGRTAGRSNRPRFRRT